MRKIDLLLNEYGESHVNPTNKMIHWICVPIIVFSIIGLMMSVPAKYSGSQANVAMLLILLASLYYFGLSLPLLIGFFPLAIIMYVANDLMYNYLLPTNVDYRIVLIILFLLAWIGQFIGHKIEGKKPSFLKDIQFLLIGPVWLLHFLYKRLGIRY